MIVPVGSLPPAAIEYPEDDGNPMSESMLQFEWFAKLHGGFEVLFRKNPDVFVAGDLLWYPVEGDNKTHVAPDTMIVFGRPKGHRRSYLQWNENGIGPHVVFELMSPSNGPSEMVRKREFYERFGVEEFYIYHPHEVTFSGYLRDATGRLVSIPQTNGFRSPRTGVRFELNSEQLVIHCPDGGRFMTYLEVSNLADRNAKIADHETERANGLALLRRQVTLRVAMTERADTAKRRLEQLRAKMIAAGLDPDANDAE